MNPKSESESESEFVSDPASESSATGEVVPAPTPAASGPAVERMFPFVLRARILVVGRDVLIRSKSKLHFILITTDLSENSKRQVLADFSYYPVVQYYTSADLEKHFGLKGTKVVGFKKSGLAQSIYAELKAHRLNKPPLSGSAAKGAAPENPS
jgi:hypothetical protein